MPIPRWLIDVGPEGQEVVLGRLAALFEHLPMRQDTLAKRTDVKPSTVSRWASGKTKPSLQRMQRIAEVTSTYLEESQQILVELQEALELVDQAGKAPTLEQKLAAAEALRRLYRDTQ